MYSSANPAGLFALKILIQFPLELIHITSLHTIN
jgi:hypothetical protein